MTARKSPPGFAAGEASMQKSIRFALWAQAQSGPITFDRIQSAFRVGRATAYRWLAAWTAVIETPTPAGAKQRGNNRNTSQEKKR